MIRPMMTNGDLNRLEKCSDILSRAYPVLRATRRRSGPMYDSWFELIQHVEDELIMAGWDCPGAETEQEDEEG